MMYGIQQCFVGTFATLTEAFVRRYAKIVSLAENLNEGLSDMHEHNHFVVLWKEVTCKHTAFRILIA
jgi:hypothetical protein